MAPTPETRDLHPLSEESTLKYKEILRSNGITDTILEVVVKDPGLRGEGMIAQSQYITVKFENPQLKQLNLFAKTQIDNPSHQEMVSEMKVFEKEARFYVDYLPAASKMCKSKGQDQLTDIYPKCYYGDKNLILLENLVLDKGYVLLKKEEMQTLDEAKAALDTLAKHHAVAHAMIEEYGGVEKFFEAFPSLDFEPYLLPECINVMQPMFNNAINNNISILKKHNVEGKDDAIQKLDTEGRRAHDIAIETIKGNPEDEKILYTLNHGDYWNNNMMYLKDNVTNEILHHVTVDMQILRYNSALLDVGYYLFTSVKPEVRRSHLHELLHLYLDTLKKVSKELDHAIVISYEELFRQFCLKFKMGYWFAIAIGAGPGMAVLKEIDVSKIDMNDWHNEWDKAVQKWLNANPELGEKMAKDTVQLVDEYYRLTLPDPLQSANINHSPSAETISKYKEILKTNGIVDAVSEILIKDPGLQGEGMVAQPKYITVKFENPQLKPMNFFAKTLVNNPSHIEMVNEMKAFEKEARFYMEYLPAATKMCKSKGQDNLVDIYPKCYYGGNDLILLENLVLDKGYILLNKEEMQTLEEARVALKTLAEHHAISYATIQEHGGPENFFKAFPNLDFDPFLTPTSLSMLEPMFNNAVNNNIKILEKHDIEGSDYAIQKLKTEGRRSHEVVVEVLKGNPDEKTLRTLNHGDYWNNNMMFLKDKDTNKILHHVAIDMQIVRYHSPLVDVGYYLFTSVKPDVRRPHLHGLLNFYLDTLKKVSKDLGHAIEMSFEELFLQFRSKFRMGFWFGMLLTGGPGMAALKEIDVSKVDMNDWHNEFDKAVQNWINANPEKGEQMAKDTVKLIEEYYQLLLEE